jgi:ATP-binding cassette, subfamily G (WHITE), member 2, SNQ2
LPFFFVIFSLFNGVVRPYSQLSVFWRYWLYYLNPSTYWIGGVLSAALNNTPVHCSPQEAAYFNPPPGSTCATYAKDFLREAGGKLLNPDATSACGYCEFTSGVDFMRTLNIEPKDKWPYFGIFLAFCVSNWFFIYFFIYTVRIRGWTFGFSSLFSALGKGVDALTSPFKKNAKKDTE